MGRRTISTRQHPVKDEDDPEVTIKTMLPGATAAAKPVSRTSIVRGGLTMVSERVADWTSQSLGVGCDTPTGISTGGRGAFTLTTSGHDALALFGGGRGIMKLDDPAYIDV